MNEVLMTIENRASCRAFSDDMIADEIIEKIAYAGVCAPSARNLQPWKIVVIKDKELINAMDDEGMRVLKAQEDPSAYNRFMERGGHLFYNAPLMFVILKKDNADLDVGIVAQNIVLAATSLGLGSVHCGMARIPFENLQFQQQVGINHQWQLGTTILVGHPAKEFTPHTPDLNKIEYINAK